MRKTFIVASTEFGNVIRTKIFIISMLLMPLLMVGGGALQATMMERVDSGEHSFAVLDETGVVGPALQAAAQEWNSQPPEGKAKDKGATFKVALVEQGKVTDTRRLELSEQVRNEQLFAFVEIPADVIEPGGVGKVKYYSNHPTYEALPGWLQSAITSATVNERFRRSSVDRATVARLTRPVPFDELNLVERDERGGAKGAGEVDSVRTEVVPIILLFLMFFPVMLITPQLINSVLEEKMSRISEVLLGSLEPFELMLGKLIGAGGVSVVLALTYMAGAYGAAIYFGYGDVVRPLLLVEFCIFLALAMLLYGSVYLAVGSACTTLKDAQSLAMPIGIISALPMMLLGAMIKAPDGALAVAFSFFPFSSPYLMLLRAGFNPPAPTWQVLLAMVTTAATTIGVVWAAARIFRTGLLMYGKAPSFVELIKWVKA